MRVKRIIDDIEIVLSLDETRNIGTSNEGQKIYETALERAVRYWERNYRTFPDPIRVQIEITAHHRQGGYRIEKISVEDVIAKGRVTTAVKMDE